MKRSYFILVLVFCFYFTGCGRYEKMYDDQNYESLTNEKGNIELYSGGKLITSFTDAKIIYSDSNSFALWIKTSDGDTIYWQGEALIRMK